MATGRLGTADVGAGAYTTVYTCPASTFSIVSISLVNRASQSAFVKLSVSDAATPTNDEFLEFNVELTSKGVLEGTGIVMGAGNLLVVYSNQAGVSAVAFGIETST